MKIALLSSKSSRCGIATYTSHLEAALTVCGAEPRHWGSGEPAVFAQMRYWRPDVLHVQYERAIMPNDDAMATAVAEARKEGTACIATLHSETRESASMAERAGFDMVLLHRPPGILPGAGVISMPCPVYEPRLDRDALRRKYGFKEDAFVLSTVGFLFPWKMTSEIAEGLITFLKATPRAALQIIAASHFNPEMKQYAAKCSEALERLSGVVGRRIVHVSGYPSDAEVLDRLSLSDLGYVYCPFDTSSSSAAASLFVSAHCPLVASTSTHYDHLPPCVARVQNGSPSMFAETVARIARDPALLSRMREGLGLEYSETNYVEFARIHLGLYLTLKVRRAAMAGVPS